MYTRAPALEAGLPDDFQVLRGDQGQWGLQCLRCLRVSWWVPGVAVRPSSFQQAAITHLVLDHGAAPPPAAAS